MVFDFPCRVWPNSVLHLVFAGVLSVIDPLDYESAREYFLSVLATDGGTPPLSNTAIVKVNITDANDNAPVFGMTVYHAEVSEDADVKAVVVQV